MNISAMSASRLCVLLAISLSNFACGPANLTLPVPTSESPSQPQLSSTPSSPPPIVIENYSDILYETVFTIPVGEAGVAYRGVDMPGMEITGPDALAILSDMSVVVADLIGNRLLSYDSKGKLLEAVDLYSQEIVNIWDLRTFKDELILLEISLNISPERYRVNRLSANGRLIAAYDIPRGYHLQDGLTGIAVDCEGQILLEMKSGYKYYRLVDSAGNLNFSDTNNDYLCSGKSYRVVGSDIGKPAKLAAGNVELETQFTVGLGGLRLLGVLADGSVYVVREDVVAKQPMITVDQTVHYMSADGLQLGVARVPIAEAYYYVMRNLAVGPDGYVYALLPRPDAVHIVRLKLFRSIAPLVPNAVAPLVTRSSARP